MNTIAKGLDNMDVPSFSKQGHIRSEPHALVTFQLFKTSLTYCSVLVMELSSLLVSMRGDNVLFMTVTAN